MGMPLNIIFTGPFSMRIITAIGTYITEKVEAHLVTKTKLYKIFIELAMNVSKYSYEQYVNCDASANGMGELKVFEDEGYFYCQTRNKILEEQGDILIKNCETINSSSHTDLRLMRSCLRKEAPIRDTGAHIGLITIKLFSENQIEYEVTKDINKDVYFTIKARIDKYREDYKLTSVLN